jgi:hypothetical protein
VESELLTGKGRKSKETVEALYKRNLEPAHMKQLLLDGLVVMIRLSHSRERGSIPRRGKHCFCFCFGLFSLCSLRCVEP